MSLRISGKNMDIGEALRSHVSSHLNAIALKYCALPLTGHIIIEPEGSGFRTDCTLHLSSGTIIQTDGKAQEPYRSFGRAASRVEKRLSRYKKKLVDHHSRNAISPAQDKECEIALPLTPEDGEEGDLNPAVIIEPCSNVKLMSLTNAVMELDVQNVPVVIFRHGKSEIPNIVYRRPDGNIGWIDPTRS